MTPNEYQKLALRTSPEGNRHDQLRHCALGIGGEAGEIIEMVKKHAYHDKPFKNRELAKELGDLLWYITVLADHIGIGLETIMRMNIDKLKERYPTGFQTWDEHRKDEKKDPIKAELF